MFLPCSWILSRRKVVDDWNLLWKTIQKTIFLPCGFNRLIRASLPDLRPCVLLETDTARVIREHLGKMDRSLRDHISDLQIRLGDLNAKLMDDARTLAERNEIESNIRATQLVLDYYLRALQLERELSR
jgi:hypothetical protein